ncbi:hypothetical protein D3C84_847590 [compost metagenome]
MAVPVEHGHGIPSLDPGGRQGIGQPVNPFVESLVAVTQLVSVDNLLPGFVAYTRKQQALDQQWVGVCALCRRNYFCL